MGLEGITRIEEFDRTTEEKPRFDKMLQRVYDGLNSKIFTVAKFRPHRLHRRHLGVQ